MRFQFIGNACGVFHGLAGTQILCDPWIIDGVMEGSWFHYPPLATGLDDIQHVDAIFLSHLHPDHYDQRNFKFPQDIPIIVLDQEPNFLIKLLSKSGYTNLLKVKNSETILFNEFEVTLFGPFTKNYFHDAKVGQMIDSAMILESNGLTAFNANDNTPELESCQTLNNRFGKFDLAMLNYNAAGPYPSCFDNLSEKQKLSEHKRILERNMSNLCKLVETLDPIAVLPFAGSFILGGKLYKKNEYLGATTWDRCASYLTENMSTQSKVVCLRENDEFDLSSGMLRQVYSPVDENDMRKYIYSLSEEKYDYEKEEFPDLNQIKKDLADAAKRMLQRSANYGIRFNTNIAMLINNEEIVVVEEKYSDANLICEMDLRLLRRILDRKSQWNNAEIGCHITFWREPNIYDPDAHTALQFLHL